MFCQQLEMFGENFTKFFRETASFPTIVNSEKKFADNRRDHFSNFMIGKALGRATKFFH